MKVYIDMDSGTVLNGPIFEVHASEIDVEMMCDSDDVARDWANTMGVEVR